MSPDEYERRLDKIRKCLRLSKSAEANEAAAAMRQAQALMRELGIDESELGLEAITDELVITKHPMGAGRYLLTLVAIINEVFGTASVMERGNGIAITRANIRYFGPRSRVVVAAYSHRVVDRAIEKAWRAIKDDFNELPGARLSFKLAFLSTIYSKVQAMAISPAEQVAMQRRQDAKYGKIGSVGPKGDYEYNDRAGRAGLQAGSGFDLHRPMEGAAPKARRLE